MAALTKAGFEIVPKDNPAAAAVNSLETMPVKVVVFEEPDDVSEGPTLAPRDVHTLPGGRRSSVMTLNGRRILQAVAQERWAMLSTREFETYKRFLEDWSEGEASGPRSGYHEALALIRAGETSAVAIAAALGGDGRAGGGGGTSGHSTMPITAPGHATTTGSTPTCSGTSTPPRVIHTRLWALKCERPGSRRGHRLRTRSSGCVSDEAMRSRIWERLTGR